MRLNDVLEEMARDLNTAGGWRLVEGHPGWQVRDFYRGTERFRVVLPNKEPYPDPGLPPEGNDAA